MDEFFYNKNIECPRCKITFTTKRVRRRKLRIVGRDSDLNIKYKDVNPLHYLVWICPNCGYSATESEYTELTKDDIKLLQKKYSQNGYKEIMVVYVV